MQLPPGFTAAPATQRDAPAIAAVMSASRAAAGDASAISAEELRSDWSGVDLATASLVIRDLSGTIAGYADIDNQANVVTSIYAYVAPAFRGRGVGTALRQWGEAYARQAMRSAPVGDQVLVQQFIPSPAVSARQLLEDSGYRAVRETFVMEMSLDRPLPEPVWPPGITVRPFIPGHDDQATFEAVEDAFGDLWGRPRGTYERFAAMVTAPGFDPALWLIALDGDEIAGTGLARALSDEGGIDVIGVRRPWRRRGVGLALLQSLVAALKARGLRTVSLSVDAESRTGAPTLRSRRHDCPHQLSALPQGTTTWPRPGCAGQRRVNRDHWPRHFGSHPRSPECWRARCRGPARADDGMRSGAVEWQPPSQVLVSKNRLVCG